MFILQQLISKQKNHNSSALHVCQWKVEVFISLKQQEENKENAVRFSQGQVKKIFIYVFIWLCWVLVAACELLVEAHGF